MTRKEVWSSYQVYRLIEFYLIFCEGSFRKVDIQIKSKFYFYKLKLVTIEPLDNFWIKSRSCNLFNWTKAKT